MSEITDFREPWLLALLLLAIPAFFWARRSSGRVRYSSLALIPSAGKSLRAKLAWIPHALFGLAVCSLAVAAAGPRVGNQKSRIKKQGIALMMVIDISSSMRALDLSEADRELTRLDAVKEVFEDFVLGTGGMVGRPDDAVGIVSFAGYADTRCPLTIDHGNLATVARELNIVRDQNEDGTAIGDGLGLALARLKESEAQSRVAILLTDGVNNRGTDSPLAAAELAKTLGIKVYTIGAGTNGLAPVRMETPLGTILQQMPVEIDEATLRDIAERTQGKYFRATDKEALKEIYQEIDRLERTEFSENRYTEFHEHYDKFIALALLLGILAVLLTASVFRRLP